MCSGGVATRSRPVSAAIRSNGYAWQVELAKSLIYRYLYAVSGVGLDARLHVTSRPLSGGRQEMSDCFSSTDRATHERPIDRPGLFLLHSPWLTLSAASFPGKVLL